MSLVDPTAPETVAAGWRTRLSWLIALFAVILIAVSMAADRMDRLRHLELTCDEWQCAASVDGARPLVLPLDAPPPAANIGLYAFAPWEHESSQAFQNLVVRTEHGPLARGSLQSYDQTPVPRSLIENGDLMPESVEADVLLHNGKPVGVELPNFVVLEVIETDPPEKGARLKPATLESGAVVQVPSFIDRGEKLKIDTRDRSYVERA